MYKKSPVPSIKNSPEQACGIKLKENFSWQLAKQECAKQGAFLPRIMDAADQESFVKGEVIYRVWWG